jgi:Cdc6-like AAA superfamily ATPase
MIPWLIVMAEKIGHLFPVGGPVPPDLVIGRAGEIDELERRYREELHTMLVGPRRIGKTTVCEVVCDRARRSEVAVVAIEVLERSDSAALLQLIIDRCSRLSHQAQGRRAARIARPLIEKLLSDIGVPLDLGTLASDAALPTREVFSLPVHLAREADRPVLVFFDELQRAVDYSDGEQLLIDLVDVFSASSGVSVLIDGSAERTLDAMLGPPTHVASCATGCSSTRRYLCRPGARRCASASNAPASRLTRKRSRRF